jgi:pyrroloquinoline quinone (PQQ) biosynthesis protein C
MREIVVGTEAGSVRVADHEVWRRMREGGLTALQHRHLLVGFWPLIERFPQLLALNLLKAPYGRDPGINAARGWLARNLRQEQRHAEWFLDWAEAVGITREEMFDGWRLPEMARVSYWCWNLCAVGDLAEAMAATNYAIEGVTGRWTPAVAASPRYHSLLLPARAERGLQWLRAHAEYDDAHPWEALDIITAIVGPDPTPSRRRGIHDAIAKSYELFRLALDAVLTYDTDRPARFARSGARRKPARQPVGLAHVVAE